MIPRFRRLHIHVDALLCVTNKLVTYIWVKASKLMKSSVGLFSDSIVTNCINIMSDVNQRQIYSCFYKVLQKCI